MSHSFLIKPSTATKFYIDYEWWETSRDDLNVYLRTHLAPQQQANLAGQDLQEVFDYVHPETGEVFRLNALRMAIRESAKQTGFISEHIGLIDSVFRALLVNDNRPLNALELSEIISRDPATILKTIGGIRIYRGIRPYQPSPKP